jgi:hypothetical protein
MNRNSAAKDIPGCIHVCHVPHMGACQTTFTAFAKPEFTFAGPLPVDQHIYHKKNFSNPQMDPQTKRNSGTFRVLRELCGIFAGPLGNSPTRTPLSLRLLYSRPPVLAPSCRAPSCARANLPCASRPAPCPRSWCLPLAPSFFFVAPLGLRRAPLAGASHSRSVPVPRSLLAPFSCLARLSLRTRASHGCGARGERGTGVEREARDMEVGDPSKQHLKFQSKQRAR